MILPRKFYQKPTLKVAQELLGKYLVFKNMAAKIVETEAYIGQKDLACHASKGRTKRNEVMFGKAGYTYIYMIYGMYFCLNIVTGKIDCPEAVLIRALECAGCNGPGKLTRTFGLITKQNGLDLTRSELYIEDRGEPVTRANIVQTRRIGVDYAGVWAKKPWRFIIKNSPHLSRKFI